MADQGFVQALGLDRLRRSAHEPGRVAVDLAVLLADGGEAIADLAVQRPQPDLFGLVASDATAWRVLAAIDEPDMARLRAARAAARELAWLQLTETRRRVRGATVPDRVLPGPPGTSTRRPLSAITTRNQRRRHGSTRSTSTRCCFPRRRR